MTLAQIARRQCGAFTRRQALQCGVSSREIDRRLLTGLWLHVMNDVLVAATTPVTAGLQAWTGVLAIGQPVALSGRFAARHVGLERAPVAVQLEFVIPSNRRARRLPGMRVQRVVPTRWAVVWRQGLPVVPTPVMIRQIAANSTTDVTRDVVHHALRRRQLTLHDLVAQLGHGLSGAARLRDVLEEVAPGYQVMWERRLHRALLTAGVRLRPQAPVIAPDGRTAYIDLGDEELRFGVEIDGFLNHMARFAADRRRARMLAVELDWTIAPYAVAELADGMDRVVAEIAGYVRRLRARAA
jgi:hypothetical protein